MAFAVLRRVGERVLDPVLLLLEGEQLLEGEDDLLVDGAPVVDDAVLSEAIRIEPESGS